MSNGESRRAWPVGVWALGMPILGAVALPLMALCLPEPSTTITIEAQSEIASIEIVNPNAARFGLSRVWLEMPDGAFECVQDIIVRPLARARVTYARNAAGPLFISIQGSHEIERDGAVFAGQHDSFVQIKADSRDSGCRAETHIELPANGILTLGAQPVEIVEPADRSLELMGGSIRVFGRATSELFGFIPLSAAPFAPGALYFAGELPLISGSQLFGASEDREGGQSALWRGVVAGTLDETNLGLRAAASANAARVLLVAPMAPEIGAEASADEVARRQEADTISLTLSARLFGDPNLRILYWLFGFVGIGATIANAVGNALLNRPRTQAEERSK